MSPPFVLEIGTKTKPFVLARLRACLVLGRVTIWLFTVQFPGRRCAACARKGDWGQRIVCGHTRRGGAAADTSCRELLSVVRFESIYSTASLVVDSRNAVRVQRLRRVCALFFDVGYRLIATVVGEMYVSLYSYIPCFRTYRYHTRQPPWEEQGRIMGVLAVVGQNEPFHVKGNTHALAPAERGAAAASVCRPGRKGSIDRYRAVTPHEAVAKNSRSRVLVIGVDLCAFA